MNCRILFLILLFVAAKIDLVAQNGVQGRVFFDLNDNCVQNEGENGFAHWPVVALVNGQKHYSLTQEDGSFDFDLPTGVTEFYAYPTYPQAFNVASCGPIAVLIDGSLSTVDIPVRPLASCAELLVDVASTQIVGDSLATLVVGYANLGTIPIASSELFLDLGRVLSLEDLSEEAYVYDSLDNYVRVTSSWADVGGVMKTFEATVSVDPETNEGNPVQVRLFGDPITDLTCDSTIGVWDSSTVVVDGFCNQNDSTYFKIRNVGTGDMDDPANYLILQDDILGVQDGSFQLASGDSVSITIEGNFSFHRLIAGQSPYHPFLDEQSIMVEACQPASGFFEIPGNAPLEIIDNNTRIMQSRVGELPSPANLSIYPRGVCQSTEILKDERLYYTFNIRNFEPTSVQSTNVRFAIPDQLDPATFRIGAMSHPFGVKMDNNGLSWRLVNDSIGPMGSENNLDQAVIKFSLLPKDDLTGGEILYSNFAVDMDNLYFESQTYTQFFVDSFSCVSISAAEGQLDEQGDIRIGPNPAATEVRIVGLTSSNRILIHSLDGRWVQEETGTNTIDISNVPSGVYMISIETEDGVIRKKLVIQH